MRSPAEVGFPSGSDRIAGALFEPEGEGPHPAVVLAHGFGATRAARLDRYAERFQRAGFAALAFDYRHFGESAGEPRGLLSISRQLDDWRAAVSWVRELPRVDPARVALWGTSFSGAHVVRLASEDPEVAAVIAQVPFMDGIPTTLALSVRSALGLTVLGLADLARSAMGGRPVTVPVVGAPGTAAMMAMDDAVQGFRRLYGGVERDDRVCARIGLAIPFLRPWRRADRVRCPLLVQAGEHDTLTPPEGARRAARRAPRGELRTYPVGHFDLYFGEVFEAAVADQVAFLSRVLRPSGPREPRA